MPRPLARHKYVIGADMTREEYPPKPDVLRGDLPDRSSIDSEDHFWSLVLGFDEAIVQGSPLPLVDATELAEGDAERLRGIRDCLTLLAKSRSYYRGEPSTQRSAAPFDDATSLGERQEDIWVASNRGQVEPRFGRFELVRKLGEGGAGMVYLANDPKLNRKVALKIPLPAWLLTNDLSQRFVREARLAARLTHPNIVSVYEVGEIAPICYIASEYCAGQSLADWLSSTRELVNPRTAAELVASLCDAVQYAHARGVLHRDIKPSNILLAETDGRDQECQNERDLQKFTPKIGDFGLAKLMDEADDLTRSGAILGTLHYLTPEQADGRVSDISVQTDVYALGAILYELITGRPVHQGSTTAETLRCILLADVVPPRRLRPEIPADLNAICLKALQRSPGRRYATAAEFREDLLRFLLGKPIIARDISQVERVYRWVRRRPALAALWLVSFAALIALVTSTMVYNNRLVTAAARLRREVNANNESLYVRNVQLAGDAWRLHHIPDAIEALRSQIPASGEPDRREFSWKFLWNQCHTELATLVGHEGDAYCVAFSPNGKRLASAGKDGTVRLWDLSSKQGIKIFRGHQAEVNTVAFVSERQLASASDDGTVRLWDVDTGQQSACLDAKEGPVYGLVITQDGQVLASGGGDARVRLWNVANGKEIWASEPTSIIEGLAITSDARTLISGHSDSSVRCWNIAKRALNFVEPEAADSQLSVASSPDLALFAIASRTGALATYRQSSMTTWNVDASVDLDPKAIGIHALAFSPRDNTLATGTRDGLLEAWNIGQKNLVPARYYPGHRSRVWSVAWSADGLLLASSSATGEIKLWSPVSSAMLATAFPRQPSTIGSLAASTDSGTIIAAGDDGRIRTWNRKARQVQRIVPIPPNEIALAACPANDPSTVVVASLRQVQQFNLASESVVRLAELPETVRSLAISSDGRIAAIGCEHTTAMLFDARSWQLLHRLKTRALDANCVALSSDGRHLATAGVGPEIELWNTTTGEPERVLPGNFSRTTCIAFLPDEDTLVSGGTNEEICFWDVHSGQLLAKLIGRPSTITAIAVSPDGRTLATGSDSPAWVDLWDTRTKSRLVELENFAEPIVALTFTPDGNSLVAGTAGGHLVEWSTNHRHVTSAAPTKLDSVLQHTLIDDNTATNNDGSPAASRQCMDRLYAINEYARRKGFAAGYPSFRAADDNEAATIEAVLIHRQHTKAVRVSVDEFATRPLLLQSDYRNQSELFNALLAQADRWGVARGYKGALPTGFCEVDADGALRYEFVALFRSGFARQRMPAPSAEELDDISRLLRKVHEWSVDAGYVSGFPAGRLVNKQLPCVVLTAEQAEIQKVPIADLKVRPVDSAGPATP